MRVARSLKADASRNGGAVRFHATRSGIPLDEQLELARQTANQSTRFIEKIKAMKTQSKKSKEKVEVSSHQLDWRNQWICLLKQEKAVSKEIEGFLESFLPKTVGCTRV